MAGYESSRPDWLNIYPDLLMIQQEKKGRNRLFLKKIL
jgi:hypothetical protein